MTTTTRQLLAQVHHWARTNGWTNTSRGWIDATSVNDARVAVLPDPEGIAVLVTWRRGTGGWGRQYRYDVADTVQGLDVLAALGILPARFARAYAAGVESVQAFNPDRRCRNCGATSGLKMLHRSPLALAANEWQCWDNCRDSAR